MFHTMILIFVSGKFEDEMRAIVLVLVIFVSLSVQAEEYLCVGEKAAEIAYDQTNDQYDASTVRAELLRFVITSSDYGYSAYRVGYEAGPRSLCKPQLIQGKNFIVCKGAMGPLEFNTDNRRFRFHSNGMYIYQGIELGSEIVTDSGSLPMGSIMAIGNCSII